MKYPVIVVPFLKVSGMALFPFILVSKEKDRNNKVLIHHETIHMKQQAELLVIPFYLLYLINYLINLAKYREHNKAYLNIVFEREAYANERNFDYTKTRGLWFWRFYLTAKS
ncbi:hypothetical protein EOD41_04940 [Mucilaginibacter limnophilus]|uniref:DUF4157 domain-containing protein n=1 Tax=Mucilaginibacter limnophilus TaxID=1932778 RepID=A0A3S2WYT6_9SPHI|nr:hypothetical protein [Mucilaginibacter limnophilus]RVU01314.1 hypothetical protein EOD41_04940 [Mucilaginibacter limnophilus]